MEGEGAEGELWVMVFLGEESEEDTVATPCFFLPVVLKEEVVCSGPDPELIKATWWVDRQRGQ